MINHIFQNLPLKCDTAGTDAATTSVIPATRTRTREEDTGAARRRAQHVSSLLYAPTCPVRTDPAGTECQKRPINRPIKEQKRPTSTDFESLDRRTAQRGGGGCGWCRAFPAAFPAHAGTCTATTAGSVLTPTVATEHYSCDKPSHTQSHGARSAVSIAQSA